MDKFSNGSFAKGFLFSGFSGKILLQGAKSA